MEFGERLRALRKAAGMTQEQLALACGFNGQSRVVNYESTNSAHAREPTLADIRAMANALRVPIGAPVDDKLFAEYTADPKAVTAAHRIAASYLHLTTAGRQMVDAVVSAAEAAFATE